MSNIEYQIVKSNSLDSLELKVKDLVKYEWIPTGGISVNRGYSFDESFIQSMIRYNKEDE